MNKLKIYTLLLLATVFSVACTEDEEINPEESEFHQEMEAAMQKMRQGMDAVEMTMDPDVDFARMMIPHHQGSIDMSEIVLRYAKHDFIKQKAQEIIEHDTESQARLRAFLDAHDAPVPTAGPAFMQEMEQVMMKMNITMRAFNMSSDPNYDYATMMTHHHQGAIDMSQVELKYGQDEPKLEEARMIMETQQQDIVELAQFRDEHGQPQ